MNLITLVTAIALAGAVAIATTEIWCRLGRRSLRRQLAAQAGTSIAALNTDTCAKQAMTYRITRLAGQLAADTHERHSA